VFTQKNKSNAERLVRGGIINKSLWKRRERERVHKFKARSWRELGLTDCERNGVGCTKNNSNFANDMEWDRRKKMKVLS